MQSRNIVGRRSRCCALQDHISIRPGSDGIYDDALKRRQGPWMQRERNSTVAFENIIEAIWNGYYDVSYQIINLRYVGSHCRGAGADLTMRRWRTSRNRQAVQRSPPPTQGQRERN